MNEETIAAIATPPGPGGIGIVRVSGPCSFRILERLFRPARRDFSGFRPWMLHRGRITDQYGQTLDDALAVFMPGPRTFTGEDIAELQCHGGPALLAAILEACLAAGARLAERGEFSRRAFLHGRMDLAQAEAVAEMIAAPGVEGTRLAATRLNGLLSQRITHLRERLEALRAQFCLAVDFPDEEVESVAPEQFLTTLEEVDTALGALLAGFERSRCWREGILVVLAGPVNAGKSSLMNAFLGRERAIVTEHPGTTRDFLEESVLLNGLPARLVDTAGLRETNNPAEAQGIRMGRSMIDAADVILLMVDGSEGLTAEQQSLLNELGPERIILVWNKSDLVMPPADWYVTPSACGEATALLPAASVVISAKTGEGLEVLAAAIRTLALARGQSGELEPDTVVPNLRQADNLRRTRVELAALAADIRNGIPYDLCAVRLESAASTLGEITGLDTPEDVLNRIFASFCIGK